MITKYTDTPQGRAALAEAVGAISAGFLFHESNPYWWVRSLRSLRGEWVCAARTDRGSVWVQTTGQVGLPFNDREAQADASEAFRQERLRLYSLERVATAPLDWQHMPVALAVEMPADGEVLFYQCGLDGPPDGE